MMFVGQDLTGQADWSETAVTVAIVFSSLVAAVVAVFLKLRTLGKAASIVDEELNNKPAGGPTIRHLLERNQEAIVRLEAEMASQRAFREDFMSRWSHLPEGLDHAVGLSGTIHDLQAADTNSEAKLVADDLRLKRLEKRVAALEEKNKDG